ncbi:unnamed protein product [Gongylonema pulchrum]|uniref:Protein kinase domain-containing protein n=1 Tax=Gongylonema pulchrum TaxID=637853 RepID=A0A183EP31_9BILA|nr:unnamed protein product [Gongylonema pulchrum]
MCPEKVFISATDFIKQEDVRLIDITTVDAVKDKPNYYSSPIVDNETACWDDAGAALFCTTLRWGHMLVGIFQHLVAPKNTAEKRDIAPLGEATTTMMDSCSRAVEMRFSRTGEQTKIFEVIQKHDLASFISIYDVCFREVPYNLAPGA